jgi:hypothetical protein
VTAALGSHLLGDRLVHRLQALQKLDVHPERVRAGDTCNFHKRRSVPAGDSIKFSAGAVLPSRRKPDQKRSPDHRSA